MNPIPRVVNARPTAEGEFIAPKQQDRPFFLMGGPKMKHLLTIFLFIKERWSSRFFTHDLQELLESNPWLLYTPGGQSLQK